MGTRQTILDPTLNSPEVRDFEKALRQRVVGQDRAVRRLSRVYQVYRAGLSTPGRPVVNLLFLGPTGSGKTRLVEATAEVLFGDARGVIKVDCAEFQHSHEIAKLIGSPPGYLGHRETPPVITQEVLDQHHTEKLKLSLVLFDEIEKASDALWQLLLGVLDKGTLTLGDNRRVDFSRALIFMTSNLGAGEMNSILRPNLGFAAGEAERRQAVGIVDEKLGDKITRVGVEAARRKFTPEFVNRIDKTVVFKPLGETELRKILTLELNIVQQRIFSSATGAPFVFSLTEPARDFLLVEGTDLKYGARHLKRAIDRLLVHALSNLIATDQVRGGDLIRVDFDPDNRRLMFYKEAEDMPTYAMVQMVDTSLAPPVGNYAAGAAIEPPRLASAKSTRR